MDWLLIFVVVLIYLLITAFLGYLGFRQTKNAADYLLAGRRVHPAVMAISYGATFISTSAIVGFGGAAAVYGMGILWLTFLNIFLGIFIAFVGFGKRTRKMGHNLDAHTFPELLGKRFQSSFLQTASGLLIFVAMPLYAGSVIIGGAQFIAQALKIPYEAALLFFVAVVALYVVMGGLKGVMYTDAFQGVVMFVGMMLLLIFTYQMLGGVVAAHEKLTALSGEAVKLWGPVGHKGWTAMPEFGSIFWLQLVTTIVLGVGIGVLAQPQLAVRFMTVKSDRELNRAVVIGGVFILAMTGVAFIVGALTNVYFSTSPEFKGISIVAAKKNVDNIIPLFIDRAMPPWFTAVFMVTLMAAAMSTLSSQFHTMGSAFGRDVLEKGFKVRMKNSVLTTRLAMIAGIFVSALLALVLPKFFEQGSAIIARGTAIFFGLCAAAFLPMFAGGLYSKRITKEAAIACFLVGFAASFFWLFFVHVKESAPLGLCKLFFGVDTLAGKSFWSELDPIVVALPLSALTTIAVSIFTKPADAKHTSFCFQGVGKNSPV
jgi:SSS family solute:Na+ symporter